MPKTEAELRNWVVEHNRNTTHDRSLTSSYGYQRILDVDLVSVCAELRSRFTPPIRILDIGCGSGKALKQLAERVQAASQQDGDFEFWGMGVNRYEQMSIPDDRLILDGFVAHDFDEMKFHLIFSVFAIHYFWHKLEALEKIHNQLLVEGGQAFLHFPGYLVRFGEAPEALQQTEEHGNELFRNYLRELEDDGKICPMQYHTVPSYSDDGDCALLAEFGHLRFRKAPGPPIGFGQSLQAFAIFNAGFALRHMDHSQRQYVASHYDCLTFAEKPAKRRISAATPQPGANLDHLPAPTESTDCAFHQAGSPSPYRITTLPFQVAGRSYKLDVAVHEQASDKIVLICPGAYEPLAGRVVVYADLAEAVVRAQLGAVVRYNDPYDGRCDYAEFLIAKTRCMFEFSLNAASHYCATDHPRLWVMAYSSSAAAVAALACEYGIESLLLISPSFDVARATIQPGFSQFRGDLKVLIGESDQVVLPQQAYWYYENATEVASREYVEARTCGHTFDGPANQEIFCRAAFWAFGKARPDGFPAPRQQPSEAWC